MSILKTITGLLMAAVLTACGGGGGEGSGSTTSSGTGSTGSTGSASTTTTASSEAASMTLVFTDSAGATLSTNAITSGSIFYAKATLTDSKGATISNALVNFSTDVTVAKLTQTVVLTDDKGVAKVQIAPATISTASAAALTAQTLVAGTAVNVSANFQTSAASVTIAALTATPGSIQALQSAAVTTSVTVGGVAATSGQVAVTFSASCGSFSPAVVSTSSSGTATSTYQSVASCSGPISLTANAAGAATAGTGSITVAAATAANILFVQAQPQSIVASSATGIKQSSISFKVVDSDGNPIASQSVVFSLDKQSTDAGVTFSATSTAADQTLPTNAAGVAQVTIQSGALPTPVIVKAALVSTPSMFATSAGIVVTSGKASQNKSSLSAAKLSLEGLLVDGVTTTLTFRVSDRQGNPVPAGSAVTFVASNGIVGGSCLLDSSSGCTVTYTTAGIRPANGLVSILAYMDGEESFLDLNGNNMWDSNEPFTDMGIAYRDDDWSGSFDSNIEQTYPGGATGGQSCFNAISNSTPNLLSVQNSCDGTWSSSIRVRQRMTLALASSTAKITISTDTSLVPPSGLIVTVGDAVHNSVSMPSGSTVTATVTRSVGSSTCTVSSVSPNAVRNATMAGDHQINLTGTCAAGTVIEVTVTPPSSSATTQQFTL